MTHYLPIQELHALSFRVFSRSTDGVMEFQHAWLNAPSGKVERGAWRKTPDEAWQDADDEYREYMETHV